MSFGLDKYAAYVWASYAIFVLMLVWDFLMPRLHLRRVKRELAARLRREAARAAREGNTP